MLWTGRRRRLLTCCSGRPGERSRIQHAAGPVFLRLLSRAPDAFVRQRSLRAAAPIRAALFSCVCVRARASCASIRRPEKCRCLIDVARPSLDRLGAGQQTGHFETLLNQKSGSSVWRAEQQRGGAQTFRRAFGQTILELLALPQASRADGATGANFKLERARRQNFWRRSKR